METTPETARPSQRYFDERIAGFIETYLALRDATDQRVLPRRYMTFSAVADYAPDMTIVDLHSDDEWTVCLNGTAHCDHAQVDRTGRNVLATCSPEERTLRIALARAMFDTPCGLLSTLTESFEDGSQAMMESTSLPLLGDDGIHKIVTYALLAEDIEEPYSDRPVLRGIEVSEHHFIDLGYGIPPTSPSRCDAKASGRFSFAPLLDRIAALSNFGFTRR